MNSFIDKVNVLPTFWVVFILLVLNHMLPVPGVNEEMYFGLAKQYINPQWIPGSFSFTETPGTRYVFQIFIGYLLQFLSFEWVSILGKLFSYFVLAKLITTIFKHFELKNVSIIFLLCALFSELQTFFAGEWIFQEFETKTVCYFFIFLSLNEMLKERWSRAALWVVPAIYFHVLVGGWYAVALFIFMLFRKVPFFSIIKYGVMIIALSSPLLYYLISEVLVGSDKVINGVDLDWVYTYYRNPHHTVIFHKGLKWFIRLRLLGFSILAVCTTLTILLYRNAGDEKLKRALLFVFATMVVFYAGIFVSYFDEQGRILKFYLFRIGSLSYLFTLISLLYWIQNRLLNKQYYRYAVAVLSVSMIVLIIRMSVEIKKMNFGSELYNHAIAAVVAEIEPGEVILEIHHTSVFSLGRKTRANVLVSKKFVPSGGNKLYEWYNRITDVRELQAKPSKWESFNAKYQPKFIFSGKALPYPNTELVYSNEQYYFYKVL